MKSLYKDNEADIFTTDLDLRVYTSRLLGKNSSLVLHGGGNTSVKSTTTNRFNEIEHILYVKGSGWDLATIKSEGFAPVKMEMLLKMAKLKKLNDTDMVKYQRLAMIDPTAPNPSVEAILHAIIPFKFVDHTHSDAIVTITNTKEAKKKIEELYGDKVLIIPYVMPGFALAKLVYTMTKNIDWKKIQALVLMNHGLFTFSNSAKQSYENTIKLVDQAKNYLISNGAVLNLKEKISNIDLLKLAEIRYEVSKIKGYATISTFNNSKEAIEFSKQDIQNIATKGPLTPDHVIRTKRIPLIINNNIKDALSNYVKEYKQYFNTFKTDETILNPAPNFAILKSIGSLSFGRDIKEANVIKDINNHTFKAILKAQKLGGYQALSAKEIFEVEYWELEQAKLKKNSVTPKLSGKIVLIADTENSLELQQLLKAKGATVVVLDINSVSTLDLDIKQTISYAIEHFGGIDIVISNNLEQGDKTYKKIINLTKPFLKLGIDPLITIISQESYSIIKDKQPVPAKFIAFALTDTNIRTIVINKQVNHKKIVDIISLTI